MRKSIASVTFRRRSMPQFLSGIKRQSMNQSWYGRPHGKHSPQMSSPTVAAFAFDYLSRTPPNAQLQSHLADTVCVDSSFKSAPEKNCKCWRRGNNIGPRRRKWGLDESSFSQGSIIQSLSILYFISLSRPIPNILLSERSQHGVVSVAQVLRTEGRTEPTANRS